MVLAGYMMVAELFYGRLSRGGAAGVLLLALGYAAANVGVYYVVFETDHPFFIFKRLFILSAVILGPLSAFSAVAAFVVFRPALRARPPWTGLVGLAIWMSCVSVANLSFIAEASAAV
jgi:hypothetical protein